MFLVMAVLSGQRYPTSPSCALKRFYFYVEFSLKMSTDPLPRDWLLILVYIIIPNGVPLLPSRYATVKTSSVEVGRVRLEPRAYFGKEKIIWKVFLLQKGKLRKDFITTGVFFHVGNMRLGNWRKRAQLVNIPRLSVLMASSKEASYSPLIVVYFARKSIVTTLRRSQKTDEGWSQAFCEGGEQGRP